MKVEIIPGMWNINAQERRWRPLCLKSAPVYPLFCKSTKVNYFSLKEFERLETIGRDDGSFKYFSSFVQVSEFVTDLGIKREHREEKTLQILPLLPSSPLYPFPLYFLPPAFHFFCLGPEPASLNIYKSLVCLIFRRQARGHMSPSVI